MEITQDRIEALQSTWADIVVKLEDVKRRVERVRSMVTGSNTDPSHCYNQYVVTKELDTIIGLL